MQTGVDIEGKLENLGMSIGFLHPSLENSADLIKNGKHGHANNGLCLGLGPKN